MIGGSSIAIICATLGKPVCEFGLRIWNKTLKMENIEWFKTEIKISNFSSWIGAVTGALSQLILDSIMHRDMRPLSPFLESNVLLRMISLPALHDACMYSGILGLVIIVWQFFRTFR